MNINTFLYPVAGVISLLILHSYASSDLALLANEGSYSSALKQAFLGGFGNTVGALAALICSILGILRNIFSSSSGIGAFVSGKLIGSVNLLVTLVAIFWNGVVGYLKIFSEGGQVYINLLGTSIFEVAICIVLILAFFLKPKKKIEL